MDVRFAGIVGVAKYLWEQYSNLSMEERNETEKAFPKLVRILEYVNDGLVSPKERLRNRFVNLDSWIRKKFPDSVQ